MGDVVSGRWDDKKEGSSNTGGEEPPGDHPMEARVAALEKAIPEIRERLARVETKLDNVEKNMATKSDVEALRGSISTDVQKVVGDSTWRFVQISAVLAGLAFTAAKFIHP
ncbi:hypothetical protein [Pseudomonas sp. MWU12-2037]|uniref:hypothetical protein n=1 Tax=Pseudomonas sp. MWU12-2037 TaxID=2928690 RepID=UPI00200D69BF|nr:hypothetical protein [Pseudomonas sp. MWU12-2037]